MPLCTEARYGRHDWKGPRCRRCEAWHHNRLRHEGRKFQHWWGDSPMPPRKRMSPEWIEGQRQLALTSHLERVNQRDLSQMSSSWLRLRALEHFGLPTTGWATRKPHPLKEWRQAAEILKQARQWLIRGDSN